MAYYLQFDGTGYVSLSTPIAQASNNIMRFDVDMKGSALSGSNKDYKFLSLSANASNQIELQHNLNGSHVLFFRVQASTTLFDASNCDPTVQNLLTVICDGTDAIFYINGVEEDRVSRTNTTINRNLNLIGKDSSNVTDSMSLYRLKLEYNNVLVHDYNPSLSNGTGTVLEDATGGRDGTLQSFNGTANSWWIFYDEGSSSGTVQALELITATQLNVASTLTLDQLAQLSVITAMQVNEASTLLLTALQNLGLITATQSNAASTLSVSQTQALIGTAATQVNEASTLTLTQIAAQELGFINAVQVNEAAILSISQQQALADIIATQVNEAGLLDIASAQAVSFIAATQVNEASTLGIDQLGSQVITLISATQVNGVETLLLSQSSLLDTITAAQLNEASLLSLLSESTLITIAAEQINTASLLELTVGVRITDVTGLTLTPVSNIFTLDLVPSTYTLE
jgi:hypothetical protein